MAVVALARHAQPIGRGGLTTHRLRQVWWGYLIVHFVSILHLLLTMWSHFNLRTTSAVQQTLEVKINPTVTVTTHTAVCVLHFRRFVLMLHSTRRQRSLSFGPQASRSQQWLSSRAERVIVWRRISATWSKYFATHGRFGMYGPHGDIRIRLMEWITILSHLTQGYNWSLFVQPKVNLLIGSLIAFECTYPAIINVHGIEKMTKRSALILLDVSISLLLTSLIPMAIVAPVLLQYAMDWDHVNYNYSDLWYAEAMLTIQRFLVCTMTDLITKTMPFLLNYATLVALATPYHSHAPPMAPSMASIIHVGPAAQTVPVKRRRTRWSYHTVLRGLQLLRGIFGIVFLVVVVMSSGILGLRDGCPPRCLAPSGLWLAWDACPCVSIELNCAQRNLTGNEPALSDILLALANAEVSILILNHCNDLVVPTAILQFPSLLGIHIYNSQLKDWSADAGVTAHYFTRLGYVLFVRTNLTQVPKALLSDLPSTLVDIEFVASATAIAFPQDVATRWTQLTTLYIEHCNLTELPSEILQMPNLDQLSLAGNHITELPSDLFSTPASRSIRYLLLNGNPLSQLPQHLEDAVKLKELYLDGTNVPVVPQTTTELHISAEDSSLCHGSAHHDTRVRCEGLHAGIYVSGAYPLDPRERSRRKANLLSTLIA